MSAAVGCVTTADCDEYVGCDDGEVCYLRQCLPYCDEDDDCDDGEQCAPCMGEDDGAEGRCMGEEGGACVE